MVLYQLDLYMQLFLSTRALKHYRIPFCLFVCLFVCLFSYYLRHSQRTFQLYIWLLSSVSEKNTYKCWLIFFRFWDQFVIFRAQEPKAPVTYCDHALSVVRPSVCRPSSVRQFTFSVSSPEPLVGFYETWYGRSTQGPLQVLLFFGQIRQGADPGRGQIG